MEAVLASVRPYHFCGGFGGAAIPLCSLMIVAISWKTPVRGPFGKRFWYQIMAINWHICRGPWLHAQGAAGDCRVSPQTVPDSRVGTAAIWHHPIGMPDRPISSSRQSVRDMFGGLLITVSGRSEEINRLLIYSSVIRARRSPWEAKTSVSQFAVYAACT